METHDTTSSDTNVNKISTITPSIKFDSYDLCQTFVSGVAIAICESSPHTGTFDLWSERILCYLFPKMYLASTLGYNGGVIAYKIMQRVLTHYNL